MNWEGYFRENIIAIAARIASGELPISQSIDGAALNMLIPDLDRLIVNGKLPPK
jgi:hypothetical protein